MNINLNEKKIFHSIQKLRPNTACGPDQVSANLLKLAGEAIVPSLLPIFKSSVTMSIVPDMWKKARICAIHKKEDETEKTNYRPISLLCLPGKLLESSVFSTITIHVYEQGLNNQHQWAYKKGSSSQLLLILTLTLFTPVGTTETNLISVVFCDEMNLQQYCFNRQ